MEKPRIYVCAYVEGDAEDLTRETLREAFSKFGKVLKIFIEANSTYAKVYLHDPECTKRAILELNGHRSWKLKFFKDEYKKHQVDNKNHLTFDSFSGNSNSHISRSHTSGGSVSSGHLDDMDEDCMYAGEYVDVHGRILEVLQSEDGQLFVNLNDVRTAGFNIYPKESFERATISKEMDLKHFENYLLNQGMKYILNFKQTFNENEMLSVFERVRAKLQKAEPPVAQFGEGRLINNTNTKNFSITSINNEVSPPSAPTRGIGFQNANRAPKQLPENFQPSFSNNKPRRSPQQNQNGQIPQNDIGQSQNNHKNRTKKSDGALWDKNTNEHTNLGDSPGGSQMRRPRPDNSGAESSTPKTVVNNTGMNLEHKNLGDSPGGSQMRRSRPDNSGAESAKPKTVVNNTGMNLEGREKVTPKPQNNGPLVTNDRNLLKVNRVQLAPGSTAQVKVSYLKPEKTGLFYGQSIENLNLIQEILLHVNTEDNQLPEIKKTERDMLCVAYHEDCWYRAIVIHENPGNAYVELIDYGNKERITTPVREMSDKMKKIPGQAIRCSIHAALHSSECKELQIDQDLEVLVKKHYDDLTHLVEIKQMLESKDVNEEQSRPSSNGSSEVDVNKTPTAPSSSEEDCFTKVPATTAKIVPGETVMIKDFTEDKLIIRNKETALICKQILEHLKQMQKIPILNPKVGQIVLCSNDAVEGLHRAVIKKLNDKTADLEFVDEFGDVTLGLKSLRNIDKVLASFPRARIEHDYPVLGELTEEGVNLLNDLITLKKKLKTTLVDDSRLEFLLIENDRTIMLSEKIKLLAKPLPVKTEQATEAVPSTSREVPLPNQELEAATPKVASPRAVEAAPPNPVEAAPLNPVAAAPPNPVAAAPPNPVEAAPPNNVVVAIPQVIPNDEYATVSYDNMPFVTAQLGRGDFSCYSCKGDSVTMVSLSEENAPHLAALSIDDPTDNIPHIPEIFEMCLAKFQDVWYRALVTDQDKPKTIFEVLFVDYGNSENISKDDLRRFPNELSTVPILGLNAYFMGIPDNPTVHKRLIELIPDESILEIDVKADINDDLKYGIEIPSVYETLRKEGLI